MENQASLITNVDYKLPSGEEINISADTVKKYLVSGNGQVTEGEIVMFLQLCKYRQLNPFTKECYLIKYSDRDPATMVISKEAYVRKARQCTDLLDYKAGIIVVSNNEVKEREGAFYLPTEMLVGGWVKIFTKSNPKGFYHSVSINEYIGKKANGEINSNWKTRPATMIRKVAIVQGLREEFPEIFNGIYTEEEVNCAPGDTSSAHVDMQYAIKDDNTYENVPKEANSEDLKAVFEAKQAGNSYVSESEAKDGIMTVYYSEYKNNRDKYEEIPNSYDRVRKTIKVRLKTEKASNIADVTEDGDVILDNGEEDLPF